MLVRIANREDTDQTASSEAFWSESALFVFCVGLFGRQLVLEILEYSRLSFFDTIAKLN